MNAVEANKYDVLKGEQGQQRAQAKPVYLQQQQQQQPVCPHQQERNRQAQQQQPQL